MQGNIHLTNVGLWDKSLQSCPESFQPSLSLTLSGFAVLGYLDTFFVIYLPFSTSLHSCFHPSHLIYSVVAVPRDIISYLSELCFKIIKCFPKGQHPKYRSVIVPLAVGQIFTKLVDGNYGKQNEQCNLKMSTPKGIFQKFLHIEMPSMLSVILWSWGWSRPEHSSCKPGVFVPVLSPCVALRCFRLCCFPCFCCASHAKQPMVKMLNSRGIREMCNIWNDLIFLYASPELNSLQWTFYRTFLVIFK